MASRRRHEICEMSASIWHKVRVLALDKRLSELNWDLGTQTFSVSNKILVSSGSPVSLLWCKIKSHRHQNHHTQISDTFRVWPQLLLECTITARVTKMKQKPMYPCIKFRVSSSTSVTDSLVYWMNSMPNRFGSTGKTVLRKIKIWNLRISALTNESLRKGREGIMRCLMHTGSVHN